MNFDKTQIREMLTDEDIFELLQEWGGEPEYTNFGIVSITICHNRPEDGGSRKLYYYSNTRLFHCYTGCAEPSFDIFELTMKVANLQFNKNYDLNTAVRYVAYRFGITGTFEEDNFINSEDWEIFENYDRLQEIDLKNEKIELKEYDPTVLKHLNYEVAIGPWLQEGISQDSMNQAHIGFFPGGDQITIPHYDKKGRFIGLRGRTLSAEDAAHYGKYRPIKINNQLYNHPLGMNLYNLNNSQNNIKLIGKAIVFESEKSTLQYRSYFGAGADISVACCGSNLSAFQMRLLIESGAKEVTIAFDRQFKEIGDEEYNRLVNKLIKLHNKYKNDVTVSFIFDKNKITSYKASPTDEGPEKFIQLYKERILL